MSTCDPQPHTITALITNGSYYPFMAVSTHSLRLSFSRTNGLLPRAAVQVRRWRGRLILLRGRSERRRRLRRLVQISHLPDLNDEEGLPRLAADASPGNAWSIGYDVQSIPLRGEELIFTFLQEQEDDIMTNIRHDSFKITRTTNMKRSHKYEYHSHNSP